MTKEDTSPSCSQPNVLSVAVFFAVGIHPHPPLVSMSTIVILFFGIKKTLDIVFKGEQVSTLFLIHTAFNFDPLFSSCGYSSLSLASVLSKEWTH